MKTLKLSDLKIELIIKQDDIPVHGNAIASGDDLYDKEVEDEILNRLENGDYWAWCSVEVRATYKGLAASDYLGACSYANEQDFKEGGYYTDMCDNVLADIQEQLNELCGKPAICHVVVTNVFQDGCDNVRIACNHIENNYFETIKDLNKRLFNEGITEFSVYEISDFMEGVNDQELDVLTENYISYVYVSAK